MLGKAIASQALAFAGRRELASEHGGPRPGGVREDRAEAATAGARQIALEADAREARAARP